MWSLRATTPIVLAIAMACGAIASQPEDAGADASDAGADVVVTDVVDAACILPCPADRPDAGAPCTNGQSCEYPRTDASCPSFFSCAAGAWTSSTSTYCPEDASACGPSLAATEGTPCDAISRCDFDGAICVCDSSKIFVCDHATPDCPIPRPLEGTACPLNGTVCTSASYADLAWCADPHLVCLQCVWKIVPTHTCP